MCDYCKYLVFGVTVVALHLQVARKLVIIEGDLERTEERAELSERYVVAPLCTLRSALSQAWML